MESANEKRDLQYFPINFNGSRQRFLEAARAIDSPREIGSWQIPSKIEADLTVDNVWLPPLEESNRLFVLTTGIHGSESYAGAAIISMFMGEILPEVDRKRTGFWIIHSMNPYGFKRHTRSTENHVNLNRNFSVDGEMFKFRNEESNRLCERFLQKTPVSSRRSFLLEKLLMKDGTSYFEEVSLDQFTKGVACGQFERPEHIEYGGLGPEPQSLRFVEKMSELVPQFEKVVHFDIHTGLGHRGRLHLLSDGKKSLNPQLFTELLDPEKDKEFYEFTPAATEGFYEVHGAINSVVGGLARPNQKVCGITLEYGTLGHSLEAQLEGLNNFLLEHQGSFYGYANMELESQIRSDAFLRSLPKDDQWRLEVIRTARGLFTRVLGRSGCLKVNTS